MSTNPLAEAKHPFSYRSNHQQLNNSYLVSTKLIGRRGLERIDLLLLAIEALDLNGSQSMIWIAKKLGLEEQFPNHVRLWKCRCHNPLRRTSQRGPLNNADSDALILLICSMAERLYPRIRQLISSNEPEDKANERLYSYNVRFSDLVSERLNIRRSAVQRLLTPDNSQLISKQLLITLSLAVGYGGVERLKASLLDPLC